MAYKFQTVEKGVALISRGGREKEAHHGPGKREKKSTRIGGGAVKFGGEAGGGKGGKLSKIGQHL